MIRSLFDLMRGRKVPPAPLPPDAARMTAFYGQFLRAGDLCFDIGSNVGNRVAVFRRLGCRVVALEPQSACFARLREKFSGDPQVTLLRMAAADQEGELKIQIANVDTISSMSPEWIRRMRESGRFKDYTWDREETVATTTLDALIAEHGMPAFVKVDVEGFEPQVLRGLSRPVPLLSFEWTPECFDAVRQCLAQLGGLGAFEGNFSPGETMELALPQWVDAAALTAALGVYENNTEVFGDVYVRFSGAEGARP